MRAQLVIAITVAASLMPSAASAWCRMTSSPRQPTASEPCVSPDPTTDPPEQYLAWLRPCSGIALSVTAASNDLSEDEVIGVFERSITTWESVTCSGESLGVDIQLLSEQSTCTAPTYRDGDGNVNAVMFVADWGEREYDPNAFAVTTVWHRRSTGEILDVDMEINERQGPYGICPDAGCTDSRTVDLENVVTHEIGHYLGLAHSEDVNATMYAMAVAGETHKRDLTPDDQAGICAVYPPGSPAGECDYAPQNGLVLHCDQGGCAISPAGSSSSAPWLALLVGGFGILIARRRR